MDVGENCKSKYGYLVTPSPPLAPGTGPPPPFLKLTNAMMYFNNAFLCMGLH